MYFELSHHTSFFLRATVQASVDGFRAIALPAARSNTAGVAVINPSLEVPGHLNINKQDTNLSEDFGPTPGGKRFSIVSEELKVGEHNEHNDSRFTISSPANANV